MVKSHFIRFDFQKKTDSRNVLCTLNGLCVQLGFCLVLCSSGCSSFFRLVGKINGNQK